MPTGVGNSNEDPACGDRSENRSSATACTMAVLQRGIFIRSAVCADSAAARRCMGGKRSARFISGSYASMALCHERGATAHYFTKLLNEEQAAARTCLCRFMVKLRERIPPVRARGFLMLLKTIVNARLCAGATHRLRLLDRITRRKMRLRISGSLCLMQASKDTRTTRGLLC